MSEHDAPVSGHVRHYGSGALCDGCGQPLCVSEAVCPRAGTHLLSDHLEEVALQQLARDLNAEFARRGPSQSRLENYRRQIPEAAAEVTQVIVDNPGQFALMVAGMVVLSKAAKNIVRPRNAVEALALAVVLQVGLPMLAGEAVRRGWLKLRVRDEHGYLIPLETRETAHDPGADPA